MFVPILVRFFSSGIGATPFPWCSSRCQADACSISDLDVLSLPHPAFQSDIVSMVSKNVVTSFSIALRLQGKYLPLVSSLHIYPCYLVGVFPTIAYSAFRT